MIKVKEMPYSEKYANVENYLKILDAAVLPLIHKHMGDEGIDGLQKIWQKKLKTIQENATFEEKYEIGYGNWISKWSSAFTFIRKNLGEEGVEEFKRADLEELKRSNSGPALYLLKVMRAISPSLAFSTIAKQMSYQLQFFTPFSVSELNGQKAVFNLPRCKVLDFSDSEVVCLVGCQLIYPMWMADLFRVNMKTDRRGNSCTVTLTPIK